MNTLKKCIALSARTSCNTIFRLSSKVGWAHFVKSIFFLFLRCLMDEYKKLFAHIGSKNDYIKIAVLLIFVMFILSSVLGKKPTIIIGVVALFFIGLGIVYKVRAITSQRKKQ